MPKWAKLCFLLDPNDEEKNDDRKRSLDQNGRFWLIADCINTQSLDDDLFTDSGHAQPAKRRQLVPPSILGKSMPDLYENISRNSVPTSLNGRSKVATITNVSGKKQKITWVDAPDDVYFVAMEKTKYDI